MVGRETAARDDPLLTARPPGPRTAVRVVLDTHASLDSQTPTRAHRGRSTGAGGRGARVIPFRPLAASQCRLRSIPLRGRDARRAARRAVGRARAAAVSPTCWSRGVAACWAACSMHGRSTKFTSLSRRSSSAATRPLRPSPAEELPPSAKHCDWNRRKCGRWPTTRISRPDAGRILGQEVAWAAGRVVGIRDGAAGRRAGQPPAQPLPSPVDDAAGRRDLYTSQEGSVSSHVSHEHRTRRTRRRRICRSPGPGRNCRPCTPKDAAHAA